MIFSMKFPLFQSRHTRRVIFMFSNLFSSS